LCYSTCRLPTKDFLMSFTDKLSRISKSKEEKIANLSERSYASESLDSSTYTDLGDGYIENNGNKIWGISEDWSKDEMGFLNDLVREGYSLPDSSRNDRRSYMYGVKEEGKAIDPAQAFTPENYDPVKLGLSSGRFNSSDYRYIPGKAEEEGLIRAGKEQGWSSGTAGVDVNDKRYDDNLQKYAAQAFESLNHTNLNNFNNRVIRGRKDGLYDYNSPQGIRTITKEEKDALFGSGSSEYYINRESLANQSYDIEKVDKEKVIAGFNKAMAIVKGGGAEPVESTDASDLKQPSYYEPTMETNKVVEAINRVGNAFSGFGATFVSELAVNPLDALGDFTGLYDLGDQESKASAVNSFFGYDPKNLQETVESVGGYYDVLVDKEASTIDKVGAAFSALGEIYTTPELLGTSLGALLAWISPGKFLNLLGAGTKYSKTVKSIEEAVNTNKITKGQGRAEKLKALASTDGAKSLLVSQSGQLTAAIGNVNNQYEQFVKNNNGNELNSEDKASYFARSLGVQLLNQNLDKFVNINIIKNPGILTSIAPAIKDLTNKQFANATLMMGKGVIKSGALATVEAAQEYSQTMMELFNTRFGTELFKDVETFTDFITDERNTTEAGIAALLGAGGAGQFEAVGSLRTGFGMFGQGNQPITGNTAKGNVPGTLPNTDVNETLSEDTIVSDKNAYKALLTRVANTTAKEGVTANNVGALLDDIDEINATKYVIDSSPKEQKEAGEAVYNRILDGLEQFVRENKNTQLTGKIVRKSIRQSLEEKTKADTINSVPANVKSAITDLGKVLGDGNDVTAEKAFDSIVSTFKSGSYSNSSIEPNSVAPELVALESALTGKTSQTLEETYDVIQDFVRNNSIENFTAVENSTTTSGNVLGSAPNLDEEQKEYTDYTRSVDAERIVNTLLGSGRSYDEAFTTTMKSFATRNNVSVERYDSLVKSYTTVEDEATKGSTGYAARISRLKGLLESSNPNKKAINSEMVALSRINSSVSASVTSLNRGIEEAKRVAADLNKKPLTSKKTQYVKTEYNKYNNKTKKYDDPYLITVEFKNGKMVPNIKGAKDLIARKSVYLKDIKREMQTISSNASFKTDDISVMSGSITIPVKEGRSKTARKADTSYLSSVSKVLNDLNKKVSEVNKVILGKDTTAKWALKGDYYKSNSFLINNEEFSADDVVLINSVGTKSIKKGFKVPDLGVEGEASLVAAMEAGATIVLDSDLVQGKLTKEVALGKEALLKKIKDKGYAILKDKSRHILIKETADNKKALRNYKEKLEKSNTAAQFREDNKEALVTLYRSIETSIDSVTGEALTDEAKAAAKKEYSTLFDTVKDNSFSSKSDRLTSFLERRFIDDVKNEAEAVLGATDPDPIAFKDKALEAGVTKYIEAQEEKGKAGKQALKDWQGIIDQDLSFDKKEKAVSRLLESIGNTSKSVINSILGEKSFSKNKKDLYEILFLKSKTGEVVVKLSRDPLSDKAIEGYEAANKGRGTIFYGNEHIFLGTRKVVQDAGKLVKADKTTVLNSLSFDNLPYAIKTAANKFVTAADKSLAKVSEAELSDQTDIRVNGKFLPGNLFLHNSPARGLVFNNKGKPNKEVLAAMYLAIGEMAANDKAKVSRGYKSDEDIATMLGLQPHEVTKEMRDFARDNGALLKTVANSLGKATLKQLGLSKKKNSTTSSAEYEALLADLGNMAVLIAQEQGILDSTSPSSNDIARLFKDGEVREIETKTFFIHLKDRPVRQGNFTNNALTEEVTAFVEKYEVAVKGFPEATTERKEPSFSPLTKDRINKAVSEVRNDIAGITVPEEAKETMKLAMETEYGIDVNLVDEFLEAVDADESNIKTLLGFIDLTSDKFDSLFYDEKEVQEAKNRDIEKSIDELRLLREKMDRVGNLDPSMHYPYFYASNNRFMLDSNTTQPQTDKLHRFFIVPKLHRLTYDVNTNTEGGLEFNVEGVSDPLDADQSFTVRLALGQALGKGVDKMDVKDIIDYGNAVLSMNKAEIAEAKKSIMSTGKFTIETLNTEVTGDANTDSSSDADPADMKGIEYELEAEHLSHALQALDFLEKVQDALTGNGKVTSALSLEFDSLTSGFANKIQQMPILDDMHSHFARVGIITKSYQDVLLQSSFKGDGIPFDPSQGMSAADILAAGKKGEIGFLDSYENMATDTITLVNEEVTSGSTSLTVSRGEGRSGSKVFEAIKQLLPGGETIGSSGVASSIDKKLRALFKDPFMIFNYSASVGRIVKNLSISVAKDIAKGIATSDFENDLTAKETAEKLLAAGGEFLYPKSDKKIKNILELQQALKDFRLKDIKLKVPLVISQTRKGTNTARNLEQLLEFTVSATYGEAVKTVFETNFKPFIKVQNAINDGFKVAFRIFDKKRVDKLKDIQKRNPNNVVTLEDHAKVLEELWDDFPYLVGPLTGAKEKKAVIAVVTTSTRSPNEIELSRKKPQTMLGEGKNTKTRTVTPLVRYLEEAISSGSVLPFHAIDGAEISLMMNDLQLRALTLIHDAIIAPLNQSDNAGFAYQKGMETINSEGNPSDINSKKNYVLAEALQEFANRLEKTISSTTFSKDFEKVTALGLKAADPKVKEAFPALAKSVLGNLKTEISGIKKARELWYGENGLMEGAYYGNLVGTPGAVYQKGMTSADLSYKNALKNMYKAVKLDVPVDRSAEKAAELKKVFEAAPRALLKELNKRLGVDNVNADNVIEDIIQNPEKADKLIAYYNNRKTKITNKTVVEAINKVIDGLSMVKSSVQSKIVDELSSVSDVDSLVSALEKIEGCK
jgi:hypothetical protein